MRRIGQFFSSGRVLGILGLLILAAFLFVDRDLVVAGALWTAIALAVLCALAALGWLAQRAWRRRAAAVERYAQSPEAAIRQQQERNIAQLRKTMDAAVATLRKSRLGLENGSAAMDALPWYMLIGSPGAGKSALLGQSGLHFPIPGNTPLAHPEGSASCQWLFTPEAVLLDTAGRYVTDDASRSEWLSLLGMLRKHRKRAPINGILIAVSIAELLAGSQDDAALLAKRLRTRVQESTEQLGVYAPVYVLFTKSDRIAGFTEIFSDQGAPECERAWGATIRYNRRRTHQDVLAFFEQHFDALCVGLKDMSMASMAHRACDRPGVFTFPIEFASIKPSLRTFLATLFDENTYQFRPVFRGFYFASAVQDGVIDDQCSERVASRFGLAPANRAQPSTVAQRGYFLNQLFRNIMFADRELVSRYTSRTATRIRYGAFFTATIVLGCALGGWSWSYIGNRQLLANVRADLDKVVRLQDQRIDLQARLEALEILQDRIEQLEKYRSDAPLMLTFGLYQGELIERKLRDEYFAGLREVLLLPVTAKLETMLAQLDPGAVAAPQPSLGQTYQEASPASASDGYNALKTYLMLGDKSRAEPTHLNDQLTRYWRSWLESHRGAMAREQMIRSAERMLSFYLNQVADPAWPQATLKLGLLDTAREKLRRVARGTPARERVYADIKARAATRFPAMTVARLLSEQDRSLIVGSHAVPGSFTREAWEKFVGPAFRDAANKTLQHSDWVLKTQSSDDLTLEGSPEQIQKSLVALYKAEYIGEWLKFLQGISVTELRGFDASVLAMNRLGDPQSSPLATLLKQIDRETAWDRPLTAAASGRAEKTGLAWIRDKIWRRAAPDAALLADAVVPAAPEAGIVGREFAGVARLLGLREKDASLMSAYLDCLSRLRTRLNQLKNQGDPGPGARQFMQQTLEGNGSELADALKFVDEQMLTGMTESQKQSLRPILVRPLVQTFGMIVLPSESEINKTWQVQVLEPFQKSLATKYPFAPDSRVEASTAEIGEFFGPDGVVAKFVGTSLGPLVIRRGDLLAARTWAQMGITLSPQAVAGFPTWIAPLSANGVAAPNGLQSVYQLQALPAPGTLEYSIEIDGQLLRYRNTAPAWTSMVHPGTQGTAGARITAITFDGRSVELFNQPGQFGLKRMIDGATRKRKENGVFELSWSASNVSVSIDLKVNSSADTGGNGEPAKGRGFHGMRLPAAFVGRATNAPGTVATLAPGELR